MSRVPPGVRAGTAADLARQIRTVVRSVARRVAGGGALVLALHALGGSTARAAQTPEGGSGTPSAERARVARGPGPEAAPVRSGEGEVWIGANDLARLLGATKFWSADVRKLVMRVGGHRIQFTADHPFVVVDDVTVRLAAAVVSRGGELQIPIAIVDSLPHDSTMARLLFDPARRVVLRVPSAGVVGTPRVALDAGRTRIVFPVDRPEDVVVASRSRAHFRVRFAGLFVGLLPDTLPEASLVRSLRAIPTVLGSGFELKLDPRAEGFRLAPDPSAGRLELEFADRDREGLEAFAPEGPPGPRPLGTVVLDPGHGGTDLGVMVEGVVEKDQTLALARLLRSEITKRLGARVILTREDDHNLTVEQRAERANQARADLVLSLHFDASPAPGARGVSAYCPPATFAAARGATRDGAEIGLALLPWRDVATRHAVRSRELADDILSALELRALGPTRLRELLPYALLGVNAPGLLLECATLTSRDDRERVLGEQGLVQLAVTIVDGLEAYRDGE